MNVLITADYRAPSSGNFIASLLELAERMRDAGNNTYFLFPDNGKDGYTWSKWLETNGFQVWLMSMDAGENEKVAFLEQIVSEHKIDLIHSHFGIFHRILLTRRKDLHNVKVLFHDHMDFSPEGNLHKQKLRTLIWSGLYRLRDVGVVSVMERKQKSYLLMPRKRNWYVPNGLSLRRNVPRELTREERRTQLGIGEDQKLCLFLGWDMYRKGVDIAVKAVAELRKKDPTVHLGLVGFGGQPSEQALNWIRERTGSEPLCDWIHFFPSTEDMFSYHRAADAYLSASRKEAFSYGILEAISQNVPVVVSNIEGTAWAKEYDKCLCYSVEDAHACANAIEASLSRREEHSNKDALLERYGINIWCKEIIEIYQHLLRGKNETFGSGKNKYYRTCIQGGTLSSPVHRQHSDPDL